MGDAVDARQDMIGDTRTCAEMLGERCEVRNAACCPPGASPETCCPDFEPPEALCLEWEVDVLTWASPPSDLVCDCRAEGTIIRAVCDIPGFVGVAVAGRRLRGPRLRALRSKEGALHEAPCRHRASGTSPDASAGSDRLARHPLQRPRTA